MQYKFRNKELVILLNLANDMREAKGDEPLEDLPLSKPNIASQCLVANAFNYGCTVLPGDDWGTIAFRTQKDLDTYMTVTGEKRCFKKRCFNYGYVAKLTPEANEIAKKFDNHKYSKYEV